MDKQKRGEDIALLNIEVAIKQGIMTKEEGKKRMTEILRKQQKAIAKNSLKIQKSLLKK